MFWAMWAVFALGVLAIAIGLLYLVFGMKKAEEGGAKAHYRQLPGSEQEATGLKDAKDHDYRSTG